MIWNSCDTQSCSQIRRRETANNVISLAFSPDFVQSGNLCKIQSPVYKWIPVLGIRYLDRHCIISAGSFLVWKRVLQALKEGRGENGREFLEKLWCTQDHWILTNKTTAKKIHVYTTQNKQKYLKQKIRGDKLAFEVYFYSSFSFNNAFNHLRSKIKEWINVFFGAKKWDKSRGK